MLPPTLHNAGRSSFICRCPHIIMPTKTMGAKNCIRASDALPAMFELHNADFLSCLAHPKAQQSATRTRLQKGLENVPFRHSPSTRRLQTRRCRTPCWTRCPCTSTSPACRMTSQRSAQSLSKGRERGGLLTVGSKPTGSRPRKSSVQSVWKLTPDSASASTGCQSGFFAVGSSNSARISARCQPSLSVFLLAAVSLTHWLSSPSCRTVRASKSSISNVSDIEAKGEGSLRCNSSRGWRSRVRPWSSRARRWA